MPRQLRINAVVVLGLAIVFSWGFMFAKHNPALRPIIPFGEDPYDAVGSFGVIGGGLLALVSLIRAFWHTAGERVYLVRTQAAVPLAVCITIASDLVALMRHPRWTGALVALLGGAILAAAVLVFVVRGQTSHRGRAARRALRSDGGASSSASRSSSARSPSSAR